MPAPKKYPDELKERAVRLVFESKRPIAQVGWGAVKERGTKCQVRPWGRVSESGAAGGGRWSAA